jgi:hypothetical protein
MIPKLMTWVPEAGTGLPDFSWYNIPKRGKIYQMTIKYTKLSQNIPNCCKIHIPDGHKMYQHHPLPEPPKCTQIGIFGLKINHLATLPEPLGDRIRRKNVGQFDDGQGDQTRL